jgi:predicted dehydrogenase
VGVIGAGAVGTRRAASAAEGPGSRLVSVCDVNLVRASALADRYGCGHSVDWHEVIEDPDVDAVVVATFNSDLSAITTAALEAGKDVLCEKPLGRNAAEAAAMVEAADRGRRVLKVGFTLRFHPALRRAHELCAEGQLGELYLVRATYGHGGRPGYEAEWRGSAELAGGGELLDQGVHLFDLARWFLGDLRCVHGMVTRWFWGIAPLEDNGFATLVGPANQVASLHSSWTHWRNRFTFEIYGRDGFLVVEGLGGSYGPETLTIGRRRKLGQPTVDEVCRFDQADLSWSADWWDFLTALETGRRPEVDGSAGLEVMRLVDAVYAHGWERTA